MLSDADGSGTTIRPAIFGRLLDVWPGRAVRLFAWDQQCGMADAGCTEG